MKKFLSSLVPMLSVYVLSYAQENHTQVLTMNFSPANAVVMIDGVLVESENGLLKQTLTVGEHSYKVMAQGYYQQDGTIGLRPEIPGKLVVELQPKEGTNVGQENTGDSKVQKVIKPVQKTTKARLLQKKELTIRDIIDYPGGIIECDGDKWTMTQSMLHDALKVGKIKCTHNEFQIDQHWIKTSDLKRTYGGNKVTTVFVCTEQGLKNYYVGFDEVKSAEQLESMKDSFMRDLSEMGVVLTQDEPENSKGTWYKTTLYWIDKKNVSAEMYVAEDDINRYELCVLKISYSGNHHSCLLSVFPKK